ncbi:MAG: transporter [Actinomycetia bacterium]|nr:transporter [Actinomycetes bacterium]
MGTAIEVRGLRKAYRGVEAVRGVDLTVEEGEVFALLGPNGAGKTTTVEILEGHRDRTDGVVSVLGVDPGKAGPEHRSRIGIVLQETGVERFLKVSEVLEEFAGYYPRPLEVDHVLDLVGLTEKRDSRVGRLSGGQQRRLDVGVGLIGNPELLFLDEPTTGFDPSARRGAWEMVRGLTALGTTVFLTTHYMEEAQQLADRVAVIVDGRIVAEGTPDTLGGRQLRDTRVVFHQMPLPDHLGDRFVLDGDLLVATTPDPTGLLHELTTWAVGAGVVLEGLEVTRPDLEEIYLDLAGGS